MKLPLLLSLVLILGCNVQNRMNMDNQSTSIKWTNSNEYYHTQLDGTFDKKEVIRQLILEILELSKDKEDWNLLVLDKWIFNLGRLIGNIQNDNQAIGMDRGYRVGVQFMDYWQRLEESKDQGYRRTIETINREIESIIIEVIQDKSFKRQLQKYHRSNPFTIEISEQGERIGLTFDIEE